MSANEELQSINAELLAFQEVLQSLNVELSALNSQMAEKLEQQRTTLGILQYMLNSTDIPALFLDNELRIRLFTPAIRSLFHIIEGDVGRPLADLRSSAADCALLADARVVLQTLVSNEREIETPGGLWFRRRILSYRTHDSKVEGVIITFNDITHRKQAMVATEIAEQVAELANTTNLRLLAASHDLRQSLQILTLIQDLLRSGVRGGRNRMLVVRLDDTLGAMRGMLNTLLDISQIGACISQAEMSTFCIGGSLDRLKEEFVCLAEAQGLSLRVVSCSKIVHSDQRLLEQMIRSLLSNALKYTKRGKVLVGCRCTDGLLSVEVWDTGLGIPDAQLKVIFEEHHQTGNCAREHSPGLGPGLSIVRHFCALLRHQVRVHSRLGIGSTFAIDIAISSAKTSVRVDPPLHAISATESDTARRAAAILLIEDVPALRDLLGEYLMFEGHRVEAVADGPAALKLVAQSDMQPDIILTDYTLSGGMDGLVATAKLRKQLRRLVPVIILTEDRSVDCLGTGASSGYLQLNKPVGLTDLTQAINGVLHVATPNEGRSGDSSPEAVLPMAPCTIFVVDDNHELRGSLRAVLERAGHIVEDFAAGGDFLASYRPGRGGCLLVDAYMAGMAGLELLQHLRATGDHLPVIMITGGSDVRMAVDAMKAGASDFIEKPLAAADLLASIKRAWQHSQTLTEAATWRESAKTHLSRLTNREREILRLVLAGHSSKKIAGDLGLHQRTVETHRASILRKTESNSLPALARLAMAAAEGGSSGLT